MQLSLRLSAIADMVTEGNRLVDVGCDHGYLPVYLILEKKIPSAIAMDVRKGPLLRAQEHIRQFGLEEYIQTRLSDGLASLAPKEGDTLVIAGMGGPLMERILTEGAQVRESFQEMILQPQSDIPHFRRFIRELGWEIAAEEMVLEDGKFYPMLRAVHGTKATAAGPNSGPGEESAGRSLGVGEESAGRDLGPAYTLEEAFGGLLLEARHPVLEQYLLREARIRRDILSKLLAAPASLGAQRRIQEVKEEQQLIQAALKKYES